LDIASVVPAAIGREAEPWKGGRGELGSLRSEDRLAGCRSGGADLQMRPLGVAVGVSCRRSLATVIAAGEPALVETPVA
jgi:hypothetical protein